jgi:Undecaprenyl-phosphate galactose phosphotransferase WbaP
VKNIPTDASSIAAPAEGLVDSDAQAATTPERQVQTWRQWLVILTLVISDILLASLSWVLALVLQGIWGQGQLSTISVALIVPFTVVWVGMRALLGLYPGYGLDPVEELRRQTYAAVGSLAITATFALGFQVGDLLSRLLVGLIFLELLLLAPLVRQFVKWALMKIGLWGKPVVVLGAGETGKHLMQTLQKEWGLGLRPVAVFDFRLASRGRLLEGVPYGGTVTEALDLTQKWRIDTAIFAMPQIRRKYLAEFVERASLGFRRVIIIPNLSGITTSAVVARDFAGTFGVEIKHNLLSPWPRRAKRVLELLAVVVGGLLLSPLLLAIAILIKLDSPGPVFYAQMRLGAGGRHFRCWKFRTMHTTAERLLAEYLQSNPDLQSEWEKAHKLRNDPRITRIGRFLRKTSLDELPQLWNVLRGDMSLIGPRPIVDAEVSKYKEAYGLYQRVSPGITGLWQVSGRSDTSYEDRVMMDTYYVRNWSVWLDFIILARTTKIVIRGRGAY